MLVFVLPQVQFLTHLCQVANHLFSPSRLSSSVPYLPSSSSLTFLSGLCLIYLKAPCWPSTRTPAWASSLSLSRPAGIAAPLALLHLLPRRPRPQEEPSWLHHHSTRAPCCAWSPRPAARLRTAWAATPAPLKAAIVMMPAQLVAEAQEVEAEAVAVVVEAAAALLEAAILPADPCRPTSALQPSSSGRRTNRSRREGTSSAWDWTPGSHRGDTSPMAKFGDTRNTHTHIHTHTPTFILTPPLPRPHCHVTLSSHICLCPRLYNSAALPRLMRLCQAKTKHKKMKYVGDQAPTEETMASCSAGCFVPGRPLNIEGQ